MTLQTIISSREEMLTSELSETELVMMHMDKGTYFGLKEVTKTVWNALDQPWSTDKLCDTVMATYEDAEREMVESALFEFLSEVLEEQLIQVENGS